MIPSEAPSGWTIHVGAIAIETGAVRHVVAAGASLLLAIVLGPTLVLSVPSDRTLHAALAYGVFGLVGFLVQAILGFDAHIVSVGARH